MRRRRAARQSVRSSAAGPRRRLQSSACGRRRLQHCQDAQQPPAHPPQLPLQLVAVVARPASLCRARCVSARRAVLRRLLLPAVVAGVSVMLVRLVPLVRRVSGRVRTAGRVVTAHRPQHRQLQEAHLRHAQQRQAVAVAVAAGLCRQQCAASRVAVSSRSDAMMRRPAHVLVVGEGGDMRAAEGCVSSIGQPAGRARASGMSKARRMFHSALVTAVWIMSLER